MAASLKFGNGNWATKEGSALAYSDKNGNFKPLPFDFTRASNGTRVNKAGLIETVGNGIPRIDFLGNTEGALLLEPQRTNLIIQSEAFGNSYWTKSGASIQGDATTAGVEQVVNGDFSTDSDWTKGTGWSISGGSANFDSSGQVSNSLLSQSFSQNIDGIINVDFLEGENSYTFNNGTKNFILNFSFSKTSGADRIRVITSGSVLYFSALNGDSLVGSIDNVSVKEVQGFASPSADSPLGAFKLVEGTNNGGHNIQRVVPVSNTTIYTSSVFVKYGGREWIRFTDAQSSNRIHFNTLTGAFGAVTGTVIDYNSIALSNGWYKLSITTTSVATAYAVRVSLAETDNDVSYTGDGTSGVYIFGASLEQGSYPTSYIKTEGSAVTRLADSCLQVGFQDKNIFGSTQGSAVFEFKWDEVNYIFDFNVGGSQVIRIFNDNDTQWRIRDTISSSWYFTGFNITQGQRTKIGFKWSGTEIIAFQNGVKSSINGSLGSNIAVQSITTNKLNNTSNMQFYNTALTDAELIALTQV